MNGYAVLVGVDKYSKPECVDQKVSDLKSCVRDAKDLEELLCGQGYIVYTLLDSEATTGKVRSTLHALARRIEHKREDRVVFFYSGHGHYDSASQQVILLLSSSCLSYKEVADSLSAIRAQQTLMIVDACESGYGRIPCLHFPREYDPELAEPAFFSLTGWTDNVDQHIYTPSLVNALRGKADHEPFGNGDGAVDIYEVIRYMDFDLTRRKDELGKKYYAHYGLAAKGTMVIACTTACKQ